MRIYQRNIPASYYNIYPSTGCIAKYKDELEILDKICSFEPEFWHPNTSEPVASVPAVYVHALAKELNKLKRTYLRPNTASEGFPHPEVPSWPIKEEHFTFNKKQWEIAAVLYRDDVERFIAHVYRVMKESQDKGKAKETYEGLWENSQSNFQVPEVVHRGVEPTPANQRPQAPVNPQTRGYNFGRAQEEQTVEGLTRLEQSGDETLLVDPTGTVPGVTQGTFLHEEASRAVSPRSASPVSPTEYRKGATEAIPRRKSMSPFTPQPDAPKIIGAGPRQSGRVTETISTHPSNVRTEYFPPPLGRISEESESRPSRDEPSLLHDKAGCSMYLLQITLLLLWIVNQPSLELEINLLTIHLEDRLTLHLSQEEVEDLFLQEEDKVLQ
ncbi:hypothetical protein FRC06_009573, partial [Ceratobasidium sp. 370]